jgi:hypothetical protein
MDWEPAGPPFVDEEGWFLSPVHAATHAVLVQGGVTTPEREAYRMVKDGGVHRGQAIAWRAQEDGVLYPDLGLLLRHLDSAVARRRAGTAPDLRLVSRN